MDSGPLSSVFGGLGESADCGGLVDRLRPYVDAESIIRLCITVFKLPVLGVPAGLPIDMD